MSRELTSSSPFIPNIDHPTQQENFNEPWVPYFRYLLSQNNSDLPQVVAQSYGDLEYVSRLRPTTTPLADNQPVGTP